jgi:hypothetical protein
MQNKFKDQIEFFLNYTIIINSEMREDACYFFLTIKTPYVFALCIVMYKEVFPSFYFLCL